MSSQPEPSATVAGVSERAEQFAGYRPLLFSIAYHLLGSVMDAEDMVQETFLRWQQVREEVQSPKAYLTTILTHLCLDRLRSAQQQREQYVGPWLPEPLLTTGENKMAETAELAESLSVAFLVVLETLSPLERAVFLLREVFDYEYDEIAAIVDKSESNVRQIAHRAKEHVAAKRPRFQTTRAEQERVTQQFIQACANGDVQGVLALLAPDVVTRGDGGGKVSAATRPVYGAERVGRLMAWLLARIPAGFVMRTAEVNGQTALIGYQDGRPFIVMSLEIVNGRVQNIYNVLNPDKLRGIPPLAAG